MRIFEVADYLHAACPGVAFDAATFVALRALITETYASSRCFGFRAAAGDDDTDFGLSSAMSFGQRAAQLSPLSCPLKMACCLAFPPSRHRYAMAILPAAHAGFQAR